MASYSASTPPKTYGGRAAAPVQPEYQAQAMAGGSATPPTGYVPSAPPPATQAPDFGSPVPPQAAPTYSNTSSGSPYAPRSGQRPQAWESQPQMQAPAQTYQAPQNGYAPGYQSSTPPTGLPPTGAPYPGGPYTPAPQEPRGWADRLGLGNLATLVKGKLFVGGAATYREQPPNQIGPDDGWSDDQIADAEVEVEVSAITQGGLEYGVTLGARAQ